MQRTSTVPQGGSLSAHRPVVRSRKGLVTTAHYAASMAGARILLQGGNAVDAAVAGAAALGVVEPYMSGLGGVGFLVMSRNHGHERKVLNFSGVVPRGAVPQAFTPETHSLGPRSSLVPASPAGWLTLLDAHGSLPRPVVLKPAIELAEEGYFVSERDSRFFETNMGRLGRFVTSRAVFMPEARPPRGGEILRQPDLARSLRTLADHGLDGFYRGDVAKEMDRFMKEADGLIDLGDLDAYKPRWESPISIDYKGYEVVVPGPNSNAFQVLETLNVLEEFDLRGLGHNSADYIHLVTEAIKLAATDRIMYGGDPDFMDVPVKEMTSKKYARKQRSRISHQKASVVMGEWYTNSPPVGALIGGKASVYASGETTHLAAADGEGTVVTVTQTHGAAFGSAVVAGGTGILLNNLIDLMDIDESSEGRLLVQPGKRPGSNMAPVQVFKDGRFFLSIGTPGAYGIPQTTTQMLLNFLEFGMDVQETVEAPRFRVMDGVTVNVEDRVPPETREAMIERGHDVRCLGDWAQEVGGGHAIAADPETGVFMGGADPRREGYALGI